MADALPLAGRPLRCALPCTPSVGHSWACCWRSSACAWSTLASASARFWLLTSTRCISSASVASSHSVHQGPSAQAAACAGGSAWLAGTKPGAAGAWRQATGTTTLGAL